MVSKIVAKIIANRISKYGIEKKKKKDLLDRNNSYPIRMYKSSKIKKKKKKKNTYLVFLDLKKRGMTQFLHLYNVLMKIHHF